MRRRPQTAPPLSAAAPATPALAQPPPIATRQQAQLPTVGATVPFVTLPLRSSSQVACSTPTTRPVRAARDLLLHHAGKPDTRPPPACDGFCTRCILNWLRQLLERIMAGHSQFKNIMHRKGRQDAAKSKLFGKLAREITVSARLGTPDPAMNARLRAAVLAARAENMPKDNIERAIKKATGGEAESYDEIRYEGYGPGGVAVIVEVLTDNRNRTAGEVRATFTKSGGNLAETGAVSFMFDRVGVVEYDAKVASAEAMLEAAIEAGAEDVVSNEGGHEIYTTQESLREVAKALEAKFGEPRKAALVWKPQSTVAVNDEQGEKLFKLIETLNEHDDVQNVYANFEVSDALMQKLSA